MAAQITQLSQVSEGSALQSIQALPVAIHMVLMHSWLLNLNAVSSLCMQRKGTNLL